MCCRGDIHVASLQAFMFLCTKACGQGWTKFRIIKLCILLWSNVLSPTLFNAKVIKLYLEILHAIIIVTIYLLWMYMYITVTNLVLAACAKTMGSSSNTFCYQIAHLQITWYILVYKEISFTYTCTSKVYYVFNALPITSWFDFQWSDASRLWHYVGSKEDSALRCLRQSGVWCTDRYTWGLLRQVIRNRTWREPFELWDCI